MGSSIDEEIRKLRNELEAVGIEVSLEKLKQIMYDYPVSVDNKCVDCKCDSVAALCWSCFLCRLRE